MTNILYLDVATTSYETKKAGLLAISAILEINGEIVSTFENEMCPTNEHIEYNEICYWNNNSFSLTNIENQRKSHLIFQEFLSVFLKNNMTFYNIDKLQIVAFNSQFHFEVLKNWFEENNSSIFYKFYANPICLLNLSSFMFKEHRYKFANMQQKTLCNLFKINFENNYKIRNLANVNMFKIMNEKISVVL